MVIITRCLIRRHRIGSNDAGKTIKSEDPVMNDLMEQLGAHLNLRKHFVGKQRVPIFGPGDIEGHLGTDGRYYLLDFARLMPPEAPLPEYVSLPPPQSH